ncbi:MAG: hypothetical protein ISS91_01140 [Candidatus Omnitrophica bacterium]|nr:hypothetical protein [Candidatus Omnitrophota bacterium]
MNDFNLDHHRRRWKSYGEFEKRQKRIFLNSLTVAKSFRIFKNLFAFAYSCNKKIKPGPENLKGLVRIHQMFGRVQK